MFHGDLDNYPKEKDMILTSAPDFYDAIGKSPRTMNL